jgi:acyl transferase domain-containing protein
MGKFLERGIFVEKLPYDRGYHTPVFTYICGPLRDYFSSLRIHPPRVELYSCTTGHPYPSAPAEILDIAADTFARPLLFRGTIEAMYAAGTRLFVEVGPRSNLTAFVDDILRGQPHSAVATNVQRRSGLLSLHHALAQLAAQHVALELDYLYTRRNPRRLQWNALKDTPVDEDAMPGTIQVPLWYPTMSVDESCRPTKAGAVTVRPTPDHELASSPIQSPASLAMMNSAAAPLPASDSSVPGTDAVMRAHFQMMEKFLQSQEEVMAAFLELGPDAPQGNTATTARAKAFMESPLPQANIAIAVLRDPPAAPIALEAIPTVPLSPVPAPADGADVERILISVVSEKTGYPPDRLGSGS